MNQITSFFPEAVIQATGWTLLHSLWQGAFIALLLALLLVLLHRQSARVRYAVAGGAMLTQLLLASGTFCYYYMQAQEPSVPVKTAAPYITTPTAAPYMASAQTSPWEAPFTVAQAYFEQHLPLLVALWLLGMAVMAIRFIGGLAYTQRLRHYRVAALDARWQQKASAIGEAMGVRQAVQLAESALVQVPVAIGLAKPIILLPVGAVTGLTQAQVEAILAHELAHILRRDYLVNLLQSVVDMLFFYHPAVWWMSGVVRAERENCCDDMAVAICGDTLTYARALAEIEAMRLPAAPAMALAFSGKRGSLMNRIKRLVGQPSLKPTFTEGFAAALVLVTGLLVLSFGAMASLKPQTDSETVVPEKLVAFKNASESTAPEDAATEESAGAYAYTVQDSAGKSRDIVIIKNKKGKVKELYVDGKRIPNKDIDDYSTLIEQRLQATERAPLATRVEVRRQLEQERAAVAATQRNLNQNRSYQFNYSDSNRLMPAVPPVPPVPPMPAPPAPPVPAVVPPLPPVPPVAPPKGDKKAQKTYERELKAYEAAQKVFDVEMEAFDKEMKEYEKEVAAFTKEYGKEMAEYTATQQEWAREQAEHSKEMARHHQEMAREHERMAREHQAQMQRLKAELVKDGIIKKSDEDVNIQLNNESLYINGEKQPQKLYDKYKKLMNIEVNDSSDFNFQYKD